MHEITLSGCSSVISTLLLQKPQASSVKALSMPAFIELVLSLPFFYFLAENIMLPRKNESGQGCHEGHLRGIQYMI